MTNREVAIHTTGKYIKNALYTNFDKEPDFRLATIAECLDIIENGDTWSWNVTYHLLVETTFYALGVYADISEETGMITPESLDEAKEAYKSMLTC